MNPVTFPLVLQSHTHRLAALVRRAIAVVLLLGLLPLIWPAPIVAMAGTMLVREILRVVQTARHASREAAALTAALRGIFPGAPDIRPLQLRALVRREKLVVNGESGVRLLLTLSEPVRLVQLRHGYSVRASFHPGDYGLDEFDRIMHSLTHSPPVAAAVSAADTEESAYGKLPAADQLPQPPKPLPAIAEQPARLSTLWNDSSHGIADAFKEEYRASSLKKKPPPAWR